MKKIDWELIQAIIVGIIIIAAIPLSFLYMKYQYDLCMGMFGDKWYCLRHAGIL